MFDAARDREHRAHVRSAGRRAVGDDDGSQNPHDHQPSPPGLYHSCAREETPCHGRAVPGVRRYVPRERDIVCNALYQEGPLFTDPILAVLVSEEVGDTYVLAHAYFYTLQKGESYFLDDARLGAVDRRRLLCGAFSVDGLKKKRGYADYYVEERESPWEMRRNGQCFREWVVGVHPEIAHARGDLWNMFDCERWRLTQ